MDLWGIPNTVIILDDLAFKSKKVLRCRTLLNPFNLCIDYFCWLMCSCLGYADHFCWWMHWGWGPSLAYEALLLLWMWDHPRWPALHHEGWTTTLLQLLWVPLCRVLRCMWRTYRYIYLLFWIHWHIWAVTTTHGHVFLTLISWIL